MAQDADAGGRSPSRARTWVWLKRAVKLLIAVLVLAAVAWQVRQCWASIQASGKTIELDWGWTTASGLLYLGGLACFSTFVWRIGQRGSTPIGWLPCWRAYIIGHLGKYVPGKAMVVILRSALAAPFGAHPAGMAAGAFYETLIMMAAGGWIAGLIFLAVGDWLPGLLGVGAGLGFTALAHPIAFPRIAARLTRRVPEWRAALPRFDLALLGEGMAWALPGWLLMGLSHVAMIRALSSDALPPSVWPIVLASIALATVLGFAAAATPGGLGVREWILMTVLAPAIGQEKAVLSSLALRLAWVFAEAVCSGIFYVAVRPPRRRGPVSAPLEKAGAIPEHHG